MEKTILEGERCRLRALEPTDVDLLYTWENDPAVWAVSGTLAPFSRYWLGRFVEEQQFDIYRTRQLRLVVETFDGRSVGALDLFEFDPVNRRAGVGILIAAGDDRRCGYAADALRIAERYVRRTFGLHQLWCSVGASNEASLALFRSAGFVRSGVRRQWLHTPDGWEDEILFQKLFG